jgi:hypothetical protein
MDLYTAKQAAAVSGEMVCYYVHTTVNKHPYENEEGAIKGCKRFQTYEAALAAAKRWQDNVIKKYNCKGDFAHLRGYSWGWSKCIGYTRPKNGSPIFAYVIIDCGLTSVKDFFLIKK